MKKNIFAALCIIVAAAISIAFSSTENKESKTGKSTFIYEPIKMLSEPCGYNENAYQMSDPAKTEVKGESDEKQPEKQVEKYLTLKSFEREMIEIAEKAQKSSVRIFVMRKIEEKKSSSNTNPKGTEEKSNAESFTKMSYLNFSGVIVNKQGYILTLSQPLKDADKIFVNIDSISYKADIWAIDEDSKLAIIKVNKTDLPEIVYSKENQTKIGSLAVICGNPYGLTSTVKSTTVSGIDRIIYIGKRPFFGVFQIDSATNPGDPGGLCMNSNGEFMGIVWSSYFKDQMQEQKDLSTKIFQIVEKIVKPEMQNIAKQVIEEIVTELSQKYDNPAFYESDRISFVLPADQLMKISENLIKFRKVKRAFVGIKLSLQFDLKTKDEKIVIVEVTKDSPAEKFDLKVGDEITAVNNKPLENLMLLYKLLSLLNPDEKLILQIKRGNEIKTINLILAERQD